MTDEKKWFPSVKLNGFKFTDDPDDDNQFDEMLVVDNEGNVVPKRVAGIEGADDKDQHSK